MAQSIKETFIQIVFMVMVYTNGLMAEYIQVDGGLIKCMEKENFLGRMVENTKEIILKIKSMDMANFNGRMEDNMMENG